MYKCQVITALEVTAYYKVSSSSYKYYDFTTYEQKEVVAETKTIDNANK